MQMKISWERFPLERAGESYIFAHTINLFSRPDSCNFIALALLNSNETYPYFEQVLHAALARMRRRLRHQTHCEHLCETTSGVESLWLLDPGKIRDVGMLAEGNRLAVT